MYRNGGQSIPPTLRWIQWSLFVHKLYYGLFLLLPLYSLLSSHYSTHKYSYAWTVSIGPMSEEESVRYLHHTKSFHGTVYSTSLLCINFKKFVDESGGIRIDFSIFWFLCSHYNLHIPSKKRLQIQWKSVFKKYSFLLILLFSIIFWHPFYLIYLGIKIVYITVIQSPNTVSVTYQFISCDSFTISSYDLVCKDIATFYRNIEYIPPFLYTFQCSSALLNDFVAIFIYRYFLSGILGPCLFVLKQYCIRKGYNQVMKETGMNIILCRSNERIIRNAAAARHISVVELRTISKDI